MTQAYSKTKDTTDLTCHSRIKVMILTQTFKPEEIHGYIARLLKREGIDVTIVYERDLIMTFNKMPMLFVNGRDISDIDVVLTFGEVNSLTLSILEKLEIMEYRTINSISQHRISCNPYYKGYVANKLGINVPNLVTISRISEIPGVVEDIGTPCKISFGGKNIVLHNSMDVYTMSNILKEVVDIKESIIVSEMIDLKSKNIYSGMVIGNKILINEDNNITGIKPIFESIRSVVELELFTLTLAVKDNEVYLLRLTPFFDLSTNIDLVIQTLSEYMKTEYKRGEW